MPEQPPGEKTEEATPKKAHDARLEGQVAMSQEVFSAALLLAGFAALFIIGPKLYDGFAAAVIWIFSEGRIWKSIALDYSTKAVANRRYGTLVVGISWRHVSRGIGRRCRPGWIGFTLKHSSRNFP